MRTVLRLLVIVALVAACDCRKDDDPVDAGAETDGGSADSGVDAGTDAGMDAGFDVGPRDAGVDVLPDALPDGGDPSMLPLPDDVIVSDVAAFQSMRVSLTSSTDTPLVAGRDTLLRVYVQPRPGFFPRTIAAWLTVFVGAERHDYVETAEVVDASREGESDPFVFDLSGDVLRPESSFVVSLRDPEGLPEDPPAASDARFPRDGFARSMGVESNGGMDLVLVPVRYRFDGSNRLPDTSAPVIDALRAHLEATYPTYEVRVRVRSPMNFDGVVDRFGNGFTELVEAVRDLRLADGAEDREHYFGMVAPAATYDAYCLGSCVTGQAFTAPIDTPSMHAGAGIWYGLASSRSTVLHELGHTFGLGHSPCGVTFDPDPSYPFPDGRIGDWGFDRRDRTFVDPSTPDLMGYCFPQWLGGWSLRRLHDRIRRESGPTPTAFTAKVEHHVFADDRYRGTLRALPSSRGPLVTALGAAGHSLRTVRMHEVPLAHALPGTQRYRLVPVVPGAVAFTEGTIRLEVR